MNETFYETNVFGWNWSFQDFMHDTHLYTEEMHTLWLFIPIWLKAQYNIHNYMTELEGCWFRKSRFVGPPLKTSSPRWLGHAHIYARCGYSAHKNICWICKTAWRSSRPCRGGRKNSRWLHWCFIHPTQPHGNCGFGGIK